jgi:hypothetical protein
LRDTDRKEALEMTRLRRVIAWILVSIVVLSLLATLVVEEAS